MEEEISLLDYLLVLLRRRRFIILFTLACFFLTGLISLFLPNIYRARAQILPPQQGINAIASQLTGVASGIIGTAFDMKSESALYAGMLKSRTILDEIIDKFNLMSLYKEDYREDMRKRLAEDILSVSIDKKSGILTIEVEDKDPVRASEMANSFVDALKSLSSGLAITDAAQRRLFYEEQLKRVKEALSSSEEELKRFQEHTGALKVEEQAKSVIESVANLRAQIAAKEVELRVMKTYATAQNPDLIKQQEALNALNSELRKLESRGTTKPDPLMPTGKMPSVGTEYMRKLRDVKFNETLYQLISAQYESARLDEANNASVIQVIDRAVPPDKKARPKRGLISILGGFSGFLIAVFLSFFMDYIERAPEDGEKQKIEAIKEYLRLKRH